MLITPYKGELINLVASPVEFAEIFQYANGLPSIQLTVRQTFDLELLASALIRR